MIDITEEKRQITKFLIGGKITGILSDNEDPAFGFNVQTTDGRFVAVWVMKDEQCEAPGHLDIWLSKS